MGAVFESRQGYALLRAVMVIAVIGAYIKTKSFESSLEDVNLLNAEIPFEFEIFLVGIGAIIGAAVGAIAGCIQQLGGLNYGIKYLRENTYTTIGNYLNSKLDEIKTKG